MPIVVKPAVKTIAYIDGFNLYYGSAKHKPYKWLDLLALFQNTLPPDCQIEKIKYFIARVSALPHNPDAPNRQNVYLRALKAHIKDKLEIIEGHFSVKNIRMPTTADPTRYVEVIKSEEKGTDVNLAVHLLNDAWLNEFQCAAVVSNDADLATALKIVRKRHKRIILYTPGAPTRKPLLQLRSWCYKQINITDAVMAAAQLPNPIPGTSLHKPATW